MTTWLMYGAFALLGVSLVVLLYYRQRALTAERNNGDLQEENMSLEDSLESNRDAYADFFGGCAKREAAVQAEWAHGALSDGRPVKDVYEQPYILRSYENTQVNLDVMVIPKGGEAECILKVDIDFTAQKQILISKKRFSIAETPEALDYLRNQLWLFKFSEHYDRLLRAKNPHVT